MYSACELAGIHFAELKKRIENLNFKLQVVLRQNLSLVGILCLCTS